MEGTLLSSTGVVGMELLLMVEAFREDVVA